jgi:hypothetical protein
VYKLLLPLPPPSPLWNAVFKSRRLGRGARVVAQNLKTITTTTKTTAAAKKNQGRISKWIQESDSMTKVGSFVRSLF